MKLVKGAWKLLVGIKDGLVLIFMLLFFGLIFAALSARPNTTIKDGALVIALNGTLSEQPAEADPFASLAGGDVPQQYRVRDVVRALDKAATDTRVKAVVLDLDRFMGGYPADVAVVGEAIKRVRDADKPVLAYATAYSDSAYTLAANASEIWTNPFGGVLIAGPGGSQLYYKGLIDRLGVNAHVYRVGTYKAAVEPFTREDQSPEAREANQALYGSIFETWRTNVAAARPKAQVGPYLTQPAQVIAATQGNIAQANLNAGLIDRIGDRVAFGKRVAEIAGVERRKPAGSFKEIALSRYIAANPLPTTGDKIGVLTVAGEIVDGNAGPGVAAGDTIANALLEGMAKHELKALVVRVDSPGGSVTASERIRQAILEAKRRGLPVVVSMGGLAASGGYWVSAPGDVIFAEPNTITGSIGIFGLIPTFEGTLAKIGVTTDGIQTTPLSGQPDILGGTNAEVDAILQANIENGYRRFVGLVANSRGLSRERVDQIGQGRVWDGGTARQLGLVDRLGGIDDAMAEAARRANLDPATVRAVYLEKEPSAFAQFIASMASSGEDDASEPAADLFAKMGETRRATFAQAVGDMRRLTRGTSVQVRCLECGGFGPAQASAEDYRIMDALIARFAL
ncbi:signal peptide peptidase SppA [Sphingomonas sp. AX6]|uniref:signal peptide peptidase SppA n=1 Tax=Sphingomonas sp. AX6 TaxID=2653171 RepID=UPI0012F1C448|nr:signal peptide peptidase SppA [Sphingomonas sp. AX6]VXC83626.1 Protease 4 [Sphingomonas sp. AX6]